MTETQPLNEGKANAAGDVQQKKKFWHPGLRLPLTALALELSGALYLGLATLCIVLFRGGAFMTFFFILTFLSPLVGFILGIASLTFGKKYLGKSGLGISITTVVLPFALLPLLFTLTMAALLSGM